MLRQIITTGVAVAAIAGGTAGVAYADTPAPIKTVSSDTTLLCSLVGGVLVGDCTTDRRRGDHWRHRDNSDTNVIVVPGGTTAYGYGGAYGACDTSCAGGPITYGYPAPRRSVAAGDCTRLDSRSFGRFSR